MYKAPYKAFIIYASQIVSRKFTVAAEWKLQLGLTKEGEKKRPIILLETTSRPHSVSLRQLNSSEVGVRGHTHTHYTCIHTHLLTRVCVHNYKSTLICLEV